MRQRFYKSFNDFAKTFKTTPKTINLLKTFNTKPITVCEGSVRSGKSYILGICFALLIEHSKNDETLFGAVGFSSSTAKSIVGEYLENYFTTSIIDINSKYNDKPAAEIRIPGRPPKFVIWLGGANENSYKNFRGLTIKHFICEEIDTFHKNTIDEIMNRSATFSDYRILASLNPNIETHEIYKILDNWIKTGICNYFHFTMKDNAVMTEEKIEAMKKKYQPGTASYKRYILGERVNAEDSLFTVNEYNILHTFKPEEYQNYIVIADPGMSISATVFICVAYKYLPDKGYYQLDIVKEYYHINDKKHGKDIKMFSDYTDDLAKFIIECKNIFKRYPYSIIVDENIEWKRNLLESLDKYGLYNIQIFYPKKYSDEERISQIAELLYKGKLNIYEDCKNCILDLQTAVMDKKAANLGKIKINNDYTDTGHNDSLDCIAYAIAALYKYCFYNRY